MFTYFAGVPWERVWVLAWYALIAAMVGDELYAIAARNPALPPLTQVLVREIPWWVTVPFLAWLLGHFVAAYLHG